MEQVKVPFVQIARAAELAQQGSMPNEMRTIQATASSALGLIESYALSLRLQGKLIPLELEPITISSLLYDAAHEISSFANQYHVELELDTGPKIGPIIADRAVLHAALTSLGYLFVEATANPDDRAVVKLAAHHGRYGVVAGLYTGVHDFGADSLRRARALQGRARQPLQHLTTSPAAGVFVADALLHTLSTKLHVARYHKLTGLATTLTQSQQMQLV